MGILEGIIHVANIRMFHARHPYTPGMVTALIYMVFSIAWIVLFVQNDVVSGLDWVLGAF